MQAFDPPCFCNPAEGNRPTSTEIYFANPSRSAINQASASSTATLNTKFSSGCNSPSNFLFNSGAQLCASKSGKISPDDKYRIICVSTQLKKNDFL